MCHRSECDKLTQPQRQHWQKNDSYGRLFLLSSEVKRTENALRGIVGGHYPHCGIGDMLNKPIICYARIREDKEHSCNSIQNRKFAILDKCGEAHRVDQHAIDGNRNHLHPIADMHQHITQKWQHDSRE